ncbi:MAG: HEAT repeat domain-containing protein, partial [Chloroflexota bacterium]
MTNDLPNIWYMQTERDIKGLVGALKHADPLIRRRAAAALRVVGAIKAAPALKAALEAEEDPDARLALASALDYLTPQQRQPQQPENRPQSRVERLIQHLTGPRPDLALQAAIALGKLGDLQAVPALVIVFRNRRQPANVRLAAARALLVMNSAPAEVTLLGALESEKWHLRRNGAAILGRLEAEWAVEPLARALYDPNEL